MYFVVSTYSKINNTTGNTGRGYSRSIFPLKKWIKLSRQDYSETRPSKKEVRAVQNSLIKNRSYVVERAFKSFPHAHLSLRNTEKGITITPNVSVTDLEDVGLLEKKLKLHFVGKAMDEFYGTIEVDVEQLKKTGTFLMPIQAEFKDLNLLHNKHRLIISIEEENNNDWHGTNYRIWCNFY